MAEPTHRNLLIVLTGGLRADVFGGSGVWPILTPHLDALIDGGLSVTAVAASTADAPGLLSLYSGLHPRQHGVLDETDRLPHVTGWARQLHEAGYYMVGVGRVAPIRHYLHEARLVAELNAPADAECDYLKFARKQGVDWQVQLHRQQRQRRGPFHFEQPLQDPNHDVDGYIGALASTILQRMPTDKPWAMVVAFSGPGNDLPAPAPYVDVVEADKLDKGFVPASLADTDALGEMDYPRALLQRMTPGLLARIRQHYLARVCLIDCLVGMLRDAVDRHGHARNTWITLASDHGYLLGERGLIGHRCICSHAMYCPIILLAPEGKGGSGDDRYGEGVPDALLSTLDLAPTVCAIAQADAPPGCVGRSLLPGLVGQPIGAPSALCEFRGRLVFETLRHKVAFDVDTGEPRAVFDLLADAQERNNLVDLPQATDVLDAVRVQLAEALMPLRPVRAG